MTILRIWWRILRIELRIWWKWRAWSRSIDIRRWKSINKSWREAFTWHINDDLLHKRRWFSQVLHIRRICSCCFLLNTVYYEWDTHDKKSWQVCFDYEYFDQWSYVRLCFWERDLFFDEATYWMKRWYDEKKKRWKERFIYAEFFSSISLFIRMRRETRLSIKLSDSICINKRQKSINMIEFFSSTFLRLRMRRNHFFFHRNNSFKCDENFVFR